MLTTVEFRMFGFGFVNWKSVAPRRDPDCDESVVIGRAPKIEGGFAIWSPFGRKLDVAQPPWTNGLLWFDIVLKKGTACGLLSLSVLSEELRMSRQLVLRCSLLELLPSFICCSTNSANVIFHVKRIEKCSGG